MLISGPHCKTKLVLISEQVLSKGEKFNITALVYKQVLFVSITQASENVCAMPREHVAASCYEVDPIL